MKRSVLVMTVVILLAAGSISTVAAQGGQPSERACVGTTVKGWAHDPELHPLGQIVSYEAQAWHPFGQTTISPFARYCELPE